MVYLIYSRDWRSKPDLAKFQRIYADMEKAIEYCNKKNSESKRYYFWMAERVIG